MEYSTWEVFDLAWVVVVLVWAPVSFSSTSSSQSSRIVPNKSSQSIAQHPLILRAWQTWQKCNEQPIWQRRMRRGLHKGRDEHVLTKYNHENNENNENHNEYENIFFTIPLTYTWNSSQHINQHNPNHQLKPRRGIRIDGHQGGLESINTFHFRE